MSARDAQEIVNAFVASWHAGDVDQMVAYFTDDGVYQNVPREPAVGHDALRAYMAQLTSVITMTGVDIHRQISSGDVVVNERTDHFLYNGSPVSMPVCGVFEVAGDRIKTWRDYADSAQLAEA
jgi:limonene-1,2-epoxide hydrolase